MSKHDQTHVEAGFFNTHSQQLHALCGCLRDKHIFQKSEIALAIVSALMCNSVFCSSVRAEELPEVLQKAGFESVDIFGSCINDFIKGSLATKGPYKFHYISGSPSRYGYVNVFVSGNADTAGTVGLAPITEDVNLAIDKSFKTPSNYLPEDNGYPSYLSIIGSYWAGQPDSIKDSDNPSEQNITNFNKARDIFNGRTLNFSLNNGVEFYANDIYAANQDKVNNVYAPDFVGQGERTKFLTKHP